MLKNTLFSFVLLIPVGLYAQDCLFKVTLHENGKEIVINTNDIAYAVDVTPDTIVGTVARTVLAVRPNVQRYSVREPIDTIVAKSCNTMALFTNERTQKLTAISKSFVARAESNLNNKADILTKDTRVRFVSDELWAQVRDILIDCVPIDTSIFVTYTTLADTAAAIRNDLGGLSFFREQFLGPDNALVVKENGGVLPSDRDRLSVFQNGQHISPQFYTISNDTISINYTVEAMDVFEVLFSDGQGLFSVGREEFTNITSSISVIGSLPTSNAQVQVYQNGQLISPSFYTISSNNITFAFTPDISDNFLVIYIT
jgi:hypothetical protein